MFKNSAVALLTLFSLSLIPTHSYALDAGDLLDKMEGRELGGYLAASVEMAAFLSHVQGDKQRARCILDWYFDNKDARGKVMDALERFRDRSAQGVIYLLIKRECGAIQPANANTQSR